MTCTVTIPLRLRANLRGRSVVLGKRVAAHRALASFAVRPAWNIYARSAQRRAELLAAGLLITVTRIAPRPLDDHDNVRTAAKPLVDGITDALGLANDRDGRITWAYGQERGGVREHAVRIDIEPRPAPCPTCGAIPTKTATAVAGFASPGWRPVPSQERR